MIVIIKGTYGHVDGGRLVPKTSKDPPFSIDPEKEAKLVEKGVARFVKEERTLHSSKKKAKSKGKAGG